MQTLKHSWSKINFLDEHLLVLMLKIYKIRQLAFEAISGKFLDRIPVQKPDYDHDNSAILFSTTSSKSQ
jgi:hypothetical protein